MRRALLLLLGLSLSSVASASASPFERTLDYHSGTLSIADGTASIRVIKGFRYLALGDAQRVLEEYWGNARDPSVLALIVPPGLRVTDPRAWAVVVRYDDAGHVDDADAQTTDDGKLLAAMEQSESGLARGTRLVGWALPPAYDAARHRLTWGREIALHGKRIHRLEYETRSLGRSGAISFEAVASLDQLPAVQRQVRLLLGHTAFAKRQRYGAFTVATDRIANSGTAGLIGGEAAAATLTASAGTDYGLLIKGGLVLVLIALSGILVARRVRRGVVAR